MKRLWLIEIDGTPKAVDRFNELLNDAVEKASYDDEQGPALGRLGSWWFKGWNNLRKWISENPDGALFTDKRIRA